MANHPENQLNSKSEHSVRSVPRGRTRRVGATQRALSATAIACNALFGPREQQAFGILMYHRVTDPVPGFPNPAWNVPPRLFEAQLTGLLSRGFQAWPLKMLLDYRREHKPIPPGIFAVTFDDAYASVYLHAFPVLCELNIPSTVFLATAYLDQDTPFPSDDWSAAGAPGVPVDAWRPLRTAECQTMQASGLVELAAHTHTHADFRGRPAELQADLAINQAVLREKFGVERATFAFPYGTKTDGFASRELAEVVREAGLQCALTTEGQLVRSQDDPFDWGRFAAEDHDTAATLAAKLNGWHSVVRSLGLSVLGRKRPSDSRQPVASQHETIA